MEYFTSIFWEKESRVGVWCFWVILISPTLHYCLLSLSCRYCANAPSSSTLYSWTAANIISVVLVDIITLL